MPSTICTRCGGPVGFVRKAVGGLAYHPECWDQKIRAERRSAPPLEESVIRERLRALLGEGALPCEVPKSVVAVTSATGQACVGCGTTLERDQLQFEVTLRPRGLVHLHRRCLELWVTECRRGGDE
jgi:hypothetical protein